MQINYRVYPHPVLSYFSDDYVKCLYQTNLQTAVSKNAYKFSVVSKTSSKGLLQRLAAGEAKHAIHIECNATRYRKIFTSDKDVFDFEVDSNFLDGKVNVCAFIVAAKNIENFSNPDFHPDFGGRAFAIKKGDVLAVDKDRVFFAEKEHDPLRKLPSIFTITHNLAPDAPPIDIEATGNKVVIKLSDEMYQTYKKLAVDKAMLPVLSSMVVVPALISLLEIINASMSGGDFSDIEEKRWFRVLSSKLKEAGHAIDSNNGSFSDSTLVIAQKLIGQPFQLGMRALRILDETEMD